MPQIKPLKIKSFIPFNFAITKTCVAIRLAEDGTRMGGIQFRLSPSINYLSNILVADVYRSNRPELFLVKGVLKYAANLQENTHAELLLCLLMTKNMRWYCSSPNGICVPSSTWDSPR